MRRIVQEATRILLAKGAVGLLFGRLRQRIATSRKDLRAFPLVQTLCRAVFASRGRSAHTSGTLETAEAGHDQACEGDERREPMVE